MPSAISTLRGEGEKYRFQISTLKGLAKLLKKKYSQQLSILFHVKMSKKLAKRNNEEITKKWEKAMRGELGGI